MKAKNSHSLTDHKILGTTARIVMKLGGQLPLRPSTSNKKGF